MRFSESFRLRKGCGDDTGYLAAVCVLATARPPVISGHVGIDVQNEYEARCTRPDEACSRGTSWGVLVEGIASNLLLRTRCEPQPIFASRLPGELVSRRLIRQKVDRHGDARTAHAASSYCSEVKTRRYNAGWDLDISNVWCLCQCI